MSQLIWAMSDHRERVKLAIRGAVQGVGFRPFVYRLATELGLTGHVANTAHGVCIEAEGTRCALETFLARLPAEKPARSFVQSCEVTWLDATGAKEFVIRPSVGGGSKSAVVLPDVATCPDCRREVFDPRNRRYRYPFTNCTNCGPRFSILEALPYDRANTSMKGFTMCPDCQAEYDNPLDRRFHAQPNACPVCGPRLEFWSPATATPTTLRREGPNPASGVTCPRDDDALRAAAEAIRRGQIVALKGLGGFQLLVDARQEDAVRRLRERKRREEKPFAVMFPTLASVQTVCEVSPLEAQLLTSPEAPIVLLRRRTQGSRLGAQIPATSHDPPDQVELMAPATAVAPGNPNLGVMLPYTPLHHLLLAALGFPVVATSGNLSDEPICTDEFEALERLSGVADVFLVHNRPIVRPMDDSVVRVLLGRTMVLRRARGYAPLPIPLPDGNGEPRPVLAVGAHLKNTVALRVGDQVFLSQHVGDLDTVPANAAFRRVAADLPRLYQSQPQIVVADLHPDYRSTQFARQLSGAGRAAFTPRVLVSGTEGRAGGPPLSRGNPGQAQPALIGVQHHLAHVLACLTENELPPPALGVAWDGTGYGPDGTVWGGEFFHVRDDAIERVATWRPFPLPGGEAAIKEPRRAALGLLSALDESLGQAAPTVPAALVQAFTAREWAALHTMLARHVNCPLTSSVGRLFDAVAALTGLRYRARFEGQAAMELEFAAQSVTTDAVYELPRPERGGLGGINAHSTRVRSADPIASPAASRPQPAPNTSDGLLVLDWSPMLAAILADLADGVAASLIAAKFHNTLAEAIRLVAQHLGERRVVLSGGCFQNGYLTERTVQRLRTAGFQPYWHQRVPPNDGGIALGQVAAALKWAPASGSELPRADAAAGASPAARRASNRAPHPAP